MPVKWYGDKLKKEMRAKAVKNMTNACLFVEADIKKSLTGKSPSAPGDPPGKRTGTLGRSITHEVEKKPDRVVGRVGTNIIYAIPLEFGTSTMLARPFMRPGLEKNKTKIAKILTSK